MYQLAPLLSCVGTMCVFALVDSYSGSTRLRLSAFGDDANVYRNLGGKKDLKNELRTKLKSQILQNKAKGKTTQKRTDLKRHNEATTFSFKRDGKKAYLCQNCLKSNQTYFARQIKKKPVFGQWYKSVMSNFSQSPSISEKDKHVFSLSKRSFHHPMSAFPNSRTDSIVHENPHIINLLESLSPPVGIGKQLEKVETKHSVENSDFEFGGLVNKIRLPANDATPMSNGDKKGKWFSNDIYRLFMLSMSLKMDKRNGDNIKIDKRNGDNIKMDKRNGDDIKMDKRNRDDIKMDKRNEDIEMNKQNGDMQMGVSKLPIPLLTEAMSNTIIHTQRQFGILRGLSDATTVTNPGFGEKVIIVSHVNHKETIEDEGKDYRLLVGNKRETKSEEDVENKDGGGERLDLGLTPMRSWLVRGDTSRDRWKWEEGKRGEQGGSVRRGRSVASNEEGIRKEKYGEEDYDYDRTDGNLTDGMSSQFSGTENIDGVENGTRRRPQEFGFDDVYGNSRSHYLSKEGVSSTVRAGSLNQRSWTMSEDDYDVLTEVASCRGRCGVKIDAPCTCDVTCVVYETCCEDAHVACPYLEDEARLLMGDAMLDGTDHMMCHPKYGVYIVTKCPHGEVPVPDAGDNSQGFIEDIRQHNIVADRRTGILFVNKATFDCYVDNVDDDTTGGSNGDGDSHETTMSTTTTTTTTTYTTTNKISSSDNGGSTATNTTNTTTTTTTSINNNNNNADDHITVNTTTAPNNTTTTSTNKNTAYGESFTTTTNSNTTTNTTTTTTTNNNNNHNLVYWKATFKLEVKRLVFNQLSEIISDLKASDADYDPPSSEWAGQKCVISAIDSCTEGLEHRDPRGLCGRFKSFYTTFGFGVKRPSKNPPAIYTNRFCFYCNTQGTTHGSHVLELPKHPARQSFNFALVLDLTRSDDYAITMDLEKYYHHDWRKISCQAVNTTSRDPSLSSSSTSPMTSTTSSAHSANVIQCSPVTCEEAVMHHGLCVRRVKLYFIIGHVPMRPFTHSDIQDLVKLITCYTETLPAEYDFEILKNATQTRTFPSQWNEVVWVDSVDMSTTLTGKYGIDDVIKTNTKFGNLMADNFFWLEINFLHSKYLREKNLRLTAKSAVYAYFKDNGLVKETEDGRLAYTGFGGRGRGGGDDDGGGGEIKENGENDDGYNGDDNDDDDDGNSNGNNYDSDNDVGEKKKEDDNDDAIHDDDDDDDDDHDDDDDDDDDNEDDDSEDFVNDAVTYWMGSLGSITNPIENIVLIPAGFDYKVRGEKCGKGLPPKNGGMPSKVNRSLVIYVLSLCCVVWSCKTVL